MSQDYRNTVFLPKTDFPMRAGLPKKEPSILERWQNVNLYQQIRDNAKGKEKFILHDGPPYANGHLHIGHAVNKILKDVVLRARHMMGYDAPYVPGWDCHGLPIEWKIEEKYRAQNLDKKTVDQIQFREECRQFAKEWVGIQSEEFKRLGVMGDWENPYLTMTNRAEAQIVREIHKFALNGGLYKGAKPVMWSVVEQTALAEAEVEYHDHKSPTIWVRYPVRSTPLAELNGADIVIWTTTPWTVPASRAVAYGAEFDYGLYEVTEVEEDALVEVGAKLIIATELWDAVASQAKITSAKCVKVFKGAELEGTVAAHPLSLVEGTDYFQFDMPALAGEFVTTEAGTGIVHMAPGHGADDFELCKAHGMDVPQVVAEDGTYYDHVGLFAGLDVYTSEGKPGKANGAVIKMLIEQGRLLSKGSIKHSYPHSWRSKAPLIFRNTWQWFISMDENGLRDRALGAIKETKWVPSAGQNRIEAMVESRPDWCISRQRSWGVPIALFVHKETGEILKDEAVFNKIFETFEAESSDSWFVREAQYFLGDAYAADDYEQVFDVVDVWFESGSTHAFVVEDREELTWPADLYLEGSDQHRGWFQSSLLESCGTRGRAPFNAVLTHGFVLDEKGFKMSKSLGNVVKPQEVNDQYGADILRLWVLNSDYSEDMRIGKAIIKSQTDLYRRLRNTLRYLLGALDGFTEAEKLPYEQMPELEKWVMHRLSELDEMVRDCVENYRFHEMFKELHNFCAIELSAFYFDIRKDSLYCDAVSETRRRAARTMMDLIFNSLTAWLAPVLCFTAEEAWLARTGDAEDNSIHLQEFPKIPADWRDETLAKRWSDIRRVRRVVTGALELERAEKRIGSSLQASPVVYVTAAQKDLLETVDFAEVCITSDIKISTEEAPETVFKLDDVAEVSVTFEEAAGQRCERCWQVTEEVGTVADHPELCHRCSGVVKAHVAAAE